MTTAASASTPSQATRHPAETLLLRATDDGVVMPVRVIPRASRTMLAGVRNGGLLVRLNAPPVDGAANEALIGLLVKQLGVARRRIRIVSGHRARHKNVLFEGVTPEQLLDRLTSVCSKLSNAPPAGAAPTACA